MGQSLSCVSAGPVLFTAATCGDSHTVDAVLRQQPGSSVFVDGEKATAMHHAARLGHVGVVISLWVAAQAHFGLERARRCLMDAKDITGHTPLMYACATGQGEVVEYLLIEGANPFLRNVSGNTALHLSSLAGHIDSTQRLISTKQHWLMRGHGGMLGTFPCEDGTRTARFIDLHNGDGLTVLHIAAVNGSLQLCRLLARRGADLSARIRQPLRDDPGRNCVEGSTALHIAAALNQEHIIRYLLHIQNRIPNLDLRHIENRAGLKPVNCVVTRGGAMAASTTEIQFMLDDSLPESIIQLLYISDRSALAEERRGPSYVPSDSFRRNMLSVMGALLQRIKLMLACERISTAAQQPTENQEALRKDQILKFVQQVSKKKLLAMEEGSDVSEENSNNYNTNSTLTSSHTNSKGRYKNSTSHTKMRSVDFPSINPIDDTLKVIPSQGSETNMSPTQPKRKLTSQEFDTVVQEINKTLKAVEEVLEIMFYKKRLGRRRSRRRRYSANIVLSLNNNEDEVDEGGEEDAAWKGAIAGVVKPSMLAELYQAARFLITNVASTSAISREANPIVYFQKIRSTCCILRWSLNSARQHQLREWEKQVQVEKQSNGDDGEFPSRRSERDIRDSFLSRIQQQERSSTSIPQQKITSEITAKLIETAIKQNKMPNEIALDSQQSPQSNEEFIRQGQMQDQQQHQLLSDSNQGQDQQKVLSKGQGQGQQDEQYGITGRLSIIREESRDASSGQLLRATQGADSVSKLIRNEVQEEGGSSALEPQLQGNVLITFQHSDTLDGDQNDDETIREEVQWGDYLSGSGRSNYGWDALDHSEEVANQRSVASDSAMLQILPEESLVFDSLPTFKAVGGLQAVQTQDNRQPSNPLGSEIDGLLRLGTRTMSLRDNLASRQISKQLSQASTSDCCQICYERSPSVSVINCGHELCVECAFKISHDGMGYPRCPFCRRRMRDLKAIRVSML